jgi:nitronate monooxygenase
MLSPEQIRADMATIRAHSKRPLNVNFFVHRMPDADPAADQRWKSRLAGYYAELGLDPDAPVKALSRAPFDDVACAIVEELKPEVVSFHFGLPEPSLLARVDAMGAKIIGSATTAQEARWLAERGCAAIIAQGAEAGGHRGMFIETDVATQVGTFALVRAIAASIQVPVVAAGGIADGQGIAAALALGASAVQIGTAYLLCPEATISPLHRAALAEPNRERAVRVTGVPESRLVPLLRRLTQTHPGLKVFSLPHLPRSRGEGGYILVGMRGRQGLDAGFSDLCAGLATEGIAFVPAVDGSTV